MRGQVLACLGNCPPTNLPRLGDAITRRPCHLAHCAMEHCREGPVGPLSNSAASVRSRGSRRILSERECVWTRPLFSPTRRLRTAMRINLTDEQHLMLELIADGPVPAIPEL